MRKGKLAAQVAHASNEPVIALYRLSTQVNLMRGCNHDLKKDDYMRLMEKNYNEHRSIIEEWWESGHTKIVLGCGSEDELNKLMDKAIEYNIPYYPIIDKGLTEFHGNPTLTCCGFGPYWKSEIDKITNDLRLI